MTLIDQINTTEFAIDREDIAYNLYMGGAPADWFVPTTMSGSSAETHAWAKEFVAARTESVATDWTAVHAVVAELEDMKAEEQVQVVDAINELVEDYGFAVASVVFTARDAFVTVVIDTEHASFANVQSLELTNLVPSVFETLRDDVEDVLSNHRAGHLRVLVALGVAMSK